MNQIPSHNRNLVRKLDKKFGFTLIELILVMAIIVLVGALAGPAVVQIFSRQTLEKGADRVRIAMGQARVKAIQTGDVYAVFVLEGGAWFKVAPFNQSQAMSATATQRQLSAARREQTEYEEDLLPPGNMFYRGTIAVDNRAAEVLDTGNVEGRLRPILFYPDGTSQDARLAIRNEKGNFVEIRLRGLTGLSSLARIEQPQRE